jgi:hypothetical protein
VHWIERLIDFHRECQARRHLGHRVANYRYVDAPGAPAIF